MLFHRFRRNHKTTRRTDGTPAVPRRRLNPTQNDNASVPSASQQGGSDDTYESRRRQFMRNQTLTGSSSQSVTSAAEMSGTIQSPRAATHHLRRQQRSLGVRILGLLSVAALTLVFLYAFIAEPSVSYYGQVTTGADVADVRTYEQLVDEYLSGRPLERIRPLLHEDRLVSYLNDNGASEVREITSVTSVGLGRSQIVVKMREPVVAWTIDGQKRYVDNSGYIFTKNHYDEPEVTVIDESGISNTSDVKTVASGRFLQFIGRGVGFAKQEGLAIDQVIVPADTTRQVQFAIANKARTRIKLSVDRPVGEQVEDAVRAHQFLTKQGTAVRYIDVRISGRAYYMNA